MTLFSLLRKPLQRVRDAPKRVPIPLNFAENVFFRFLGVFSIFPHHDPPGPTFFTFEKLVGKHIGCVQDRPKRVRYQNIADDIPNTNGTPCLNVTPV